MSLLVQQSSFAVIEAPATALDPEGKGTVFGYGGNMDGLTRSFHLERDTAGGITVRFETTVRPTHLIVGGDAIPFVAGSSISGDYTLKLSAEKAEHPRRTGLRNLPHPWPLRTSGQLK